MQALEKEHPGGAPCDDLAAVCDQLLEASIPARHKDNSAALPADWTDMESWSRPPRHGTTGCAGPQAAWGHATATFPGPKGELFFGYYLSAATMTRDEHSPDVPGLARRMTLSSCALDPVRALVPVLQRMTAAAVAPALLRPAHQRRADLLHHQGSRRHHHRPGWCRLTGLSPLTPVDRLPAHHPQPAHP